MKYLWHLWTKALGEKASDCDNEADRVALIRTTLVVINIMTNLFIVAGIIKHWRD